MSVFHIPSVFTRCGARVLLSAATAAALTLPSAGLAQSGQGGRGALARTRCAPPAPPDCVSPSRDSAWARHERLLLRFDSLRREFEYQRLTRPERDRIADEMRRTVVALQEALIDANAPGRASSPMKIEMEAARMAVEGVEPRVAVAMQVRSRSRGYLGVSFDAPYVEVPHPREHVIRFLDYPHIVLVEPSSPAERAGIERGDTLVAFNGTDVREREISFTKLLVPRRRITVRVRRDGSTRDLGVIVGEAPSYVVSRAMPFTPVPSVAATAPPAPEAPWPVDVAVPEMPPSRRSPWPGGPGAGAAGVGTIWFYRDGVAGAEVETITEGLGRALGASSGVLVLRARPGTPAYRSGLRDGDVIVRVAGKSISTVRELRSALAESDGSEGVKLAIRRERRNRELTLRWER